MNKKIRVGVLFGGKSAEHEVSLQSAQNVVAALDQDKYEPVLIGINKTGQWLLSHNNDPLFESTDSTTHSVMLLPQSNGQLASVNQSGAITSVDVVFPILHGPLGEDGTVQGLLKLANLPFVGSDVLGSAIGMDKDVMKRLARDANIPIAKFLVAHDSETVSYQQALEQLGAPFFVKPANLGSSVGISKVHDKEAFETALQEAFGYDHKIIIEQAITGREIECAVLGNEQPQASLPGEIIPQHDFYSYQAKYLDAKGARLIAPAELSKETINKIQAFSIQAFQVLGCSGMARVDFFLTDNNDIIFNEINTIPGFTPISMYPRLWDISGINYAELIDRLIQLALERFSKDQKLKSSL